jgi:hypothetical protein
MAWSWNSHCSFFHSKISTRIPTIIPPGSPSRKIFGFGPSIIPTASTTMMKRSFHIWRRGESVRVPAVVSSRLGRLEEDWDGCSCFCQIQSQQRRWFGKKKKKLSTSENAIRRRERKRTWHRGLIGNTESQRGSVLGHETKIGVDHVILLKLDLEEVSKRELYVMNQNVQKWIDIPGVQSVTVGSIFVKRQWMEDRTGDYNHYIRLRFDGVKALKKCNNHPMYVECIQKVIRPLLYGTLPLIVNCDADMILATQKNTNDNAPADNTNADDDNHKEDNDDDDDDDDDDHTENNNIHDNNHENENSNNHENDNNDMDDTFPLPDHIQNAPSVRKIANAMRDSTFLRHDSSSSSRMSSSSSSSSSSHTVRRVVPMKRNSTTTTQRPFQKRKGVPPPANGE